jgi:hypothetical protein
MPRQNCRVRFLASRSDSGHPFDRAYDAFFFLREGLAAEGTLLWAGSILGARLYRFCLSSWLTNREAVWGRVIPMNATGHKPRLTQSCKK